MDWEPGLVPELSVTGVNFQLSIPAIEPVLQRLHAAGWPLFGAPEEKWYRTGEAESGVRQLLVLDPDGYLVRPQQPLGSRPAGLLSPRPFPRPGGSLQRGTRAPARV